MGKLFHVIFHVIFQLGKIPWSFSGDLPKHDPDPRPLRTGWFQSGRICRTGPRSQGGPFWEGPFHRIKSAIRKARGLCLFGIGWDVDDVCLGLIGIGKLCLFGMMFVWDWLGCVDDVFFGIGLDWKIIFVWDDVCLGLVGIGKSSLFGIGWDW